jgi:DNA-binding HxlR family transcriptional regulator
MKDKIKKIIVRDVQDVLEIIGGRWRGAIMACLCDNPMRFSEIKNDLTSITSRILTKELRFLEENQMINREVSTVSGNSVLYTHSEHGKTIKPLIMHLQKWGMVHREVMIKELSIQEKGRKISYSISAE